MTFRVLTRHFIDAMLAPGVLTEAGVDYLRRALFGVLAVLLVLGIFITRLFFDKYTNLGALVGSDAYLRAVQADSLMMIAVPMFVVGLATIAASPLLFPDETDYRVLTPLPITRAQLFLAKLAAVSGMVIAGILAANLISTFWFPIAVSGRKAQHPLIARVLAHGAGAVAGSIFTCLAAMAVQGVTLAATPLAWQRRVSLAVQGTMFVGLLWSIPLVTRMPAMDVTARTISQPPLSWLPPAWFFGVERWLLDGAAAGGYRDVALIGAIATLMAATVVLLSYLLLYRSAERLAGVAGADRRPRRPWVAWSRLAMVDRVPAPTLAIADFVRTVVMRSRPHQFIFMIAVGGGLAVLIGDAVAVMEGVSAMTARPPSAVRAAVSAPLMVALTFMLGLRAAMRWPLEPDAAWIFRLSDNPATRSQTLNGAAWMIAGGAWATAMATAALLQPRVLGSAWLPAAILTTFAVLAAAEFVLRDWRRVPFACTYLPGKHQLAYYIGALAAYYFVVVIIGSNLVRWSVLDPARTVATGGFLVAAWAALRRERWKVWGMEGLEFEDDDPAEVGRLGIS